MSKLHDISLERFKKNLLALRASRRNLAASPSTTVPADKLGRAFARDFDAQKEARRQRHLRENRFMQVQAEGFSVSDTNYFKYAGQYPAAFGLMGEARKNWRLCDQLAGQIHGLPSMRGTLKATNGILCAILSADGKRLLLGHIQHFVPDAPEDVDEVLDKPAKPSRKAVKLRQYA